jgi:hypothetical protein
MWVRWEALEFQEVVLELPVEVFFDGYSLKMCGVVGGRWDEVNGYFRFMGRFEKEM